MRLVVTWFCCVFALQACTLNTGVGSTTTAFAGARPTPLHLKEVDGSDTIPVQHLQPYTQLVFEKKELLQAAPGTKSVLFNAAGSRLYAMNLEGMSVYEFDQAKRKIHREFRFRPTKGTGWDYDTDKPMDSFEEKPVEACLSHSDRILWVSLHNAAGIVPIRLDSLVNDDTATDSTTVKRIYVTDSNSGQRDSFHVPLIKTGKTPKVISRSLDSKHLLVSNWHSYNVTILETDTAVFPYARKVGTVPVSSIPRGVVVDDRNDRSFVAIMGGASIAVIDHNGWKRKKDLQVSSNPRHIVMDTSGRLFVSYNRIGRIACIDGNTGATLFTAKTAAQPRTILLSKNQKFLFVTCYSSDTVQVFRIKGNAFEKVAALPCKGHPVGVDIFEDNDKLEAWVCSYTNGSISIFTFRKKP